MGEGMLEKDHHIPISACLQTFRLNKCLHWNQSFLHVRVDQHWYNDNQREYSIHLWFPTTKVFLVRPARRALYLQNRIDSHTRMHEYLLTYNTIEPARHSYSSQKGLEIFRGKTLTWSRMSNYQAERIKAKQNSQRERTARWVNIPVSSSERMLSKS